MAVCRFPVVSGWLSRASSAQLLRVRRPTSPRTKSLSNAATSCRWSSCASTRRICASCEDTGATTVLNIKTFSSGRSKQIQITSWSGTAATRAREGFLPELALGSHHLSNVKLPAIDLSPHRHNAAPRSTAFSASTSSTRWASASIRSTRSLLSLLLPPTLNCFLI
jgi:hypothetical protein